MQIRRIKITGQVNTTSSNIRGNVSDQTHSTISANGVQIFDGDYSYIPMVTAQIVGCAQKKMADDITIYPIQTRETPDASGGVHFEILSGEVGDNGLQ